MKYRLLFICLVVALFLIYTGYPCLIYEIKGLPREITGLISKGKKGFVFLYGPGVCGSCAPGELLDGIKGKLNIVIVVPEDFTENDIYNLRSTFSLKNKIVKGSDSIPKFLKRASNCLDLKGWQKNFFLKLNGDQKVDYLRPI